MKVVILAGGLGSRISEETDNKPKPMVEIGGKPILWHIMKMYSSYGFNDFVICLGYKGYVIKEFFANYRMHNSDMVVDLKTDSIRFDSSDLEPWKVELIDTGLHTMTGGRIKKIEDKIDTENFLLTYGDGVCDVNIKELVAFHIKHEKCATITAVRPPGRFGALKLSSNHFVEEFLEKPSGDGHYINGGFFVLKKKVFKYLSGDETVWEREPLERLAQDGELVSFRHHGFWHAMDMLRDKKSLETTWSGGAPWKKWQ